MVEHNLQHQRELDFSRLEEVFVMLYEADEEKVALEELIDRR